MKVIDQLNELRKQKPDCSIVALADLSSQLIFSTSAREKLPRERLDALCHKANNALNGAAARPFAALLDAPGKPETGLAIMVERDSISVFIRSPRDPAEALCCICASHSEIDTFIEAARQTLGQIDEMA